MKKVIVLSILLIFGSLKIGYCQNYIQAYLSFKDDTLSNKSLKHTIVSGFEKGNKECTSLVIEDFTVNNNLLRVDSATFWKHIYKSICLESIDYYYLAIYVYKRSEFEKAISYLFKSDSLGYCGASYELFYLKKNGSLSSSLLPLIPGTYRDKVKENASFYLIRSAFQGCWNAQYLLAKTIDNADLSLAIFKYIITYQQLPPGVSDDIYDELGYE